VTKKFARRFVIPANVLIDMSHGYFGRALRCEARKSRRQSAIKPGEQQMKTFITILGSALIIASSVQFAAAAQRHHHHYKSDRADRVVVRQQPRAYYDSYAAWPAPAPAPEIYGYAPSYFSGGYSAPAGR
jgi:hypothetical protein